MSTESKSPADWKTPWELGEQHEMMCQIVDSSNTIVAVAKGGTSFTLPGHPERNPHLTAERIVACVNALRGLPTDYLQRVRQKGGPQVYACDIGLLALHAYPDKGSIQAMIEILKEEGYAVVPLDQKPLNYT